MRGKPCISGAGIPSAGITPAGAGKTCIWCRYNVGFWDHPRRCGENYEVALETGVIRGSPPQVRGKRGKHNSISYSYRITPAGAGKTPVIINTDVA